MGRLPVLGIARAARPGVLGDVWLVVSIVLTVAAAGGSGGLHALRRARAAARPTGPDGYRSPS